jgi:hypothetical protein
MASYEASNEASNEWVQVSRGKHFDAAAKAAFGSKRTNRRSIPESKEGKCEFTGIAASAFGNKRKLDTTPRDEEKNIGPSRFANILFPETIVTSTKNQFNEQATAAFSKRRYENQKGSAQQETQETQERQERQERQFSKGSHMFDEQAASAFGKKRHHRHEIESKAPPVVFEPKNTLWASISQVIPEIAKEPEWKKSALRQKKNVEREQSSKKISEEEFPALGSSKIVSKSNPTTSFADIMRKRIEQEEAEARAEAEHLEKEERRRNRELFERSLIVGIRPRNYENCEEDYTSQEESEFNPVYRDDTDLEYIHPSEINKHKKVTCDEYECSPHDSSTEEDDDDSAW